MKSNKRILLIAVISISIGVILSIMGILAGGISDAESNVIIGTNEGLIVIREDDKVKEYKELESFDSVKIEGKIENVEVIQSDKFAIETEYYKELVNVSYKVKNNELIITENKTDLKININIMKLGEESKVKVYAPKDISINK